MSSSTDHQELIAVDGNWKNLGGPPRKELTSFNFADIFWCGLLVISGLLSFLLYQRSPDFPYEDVRYVELAKSLLHSGTYAFNFAPERVQPPGFSVILALLCGTLGCRYDVLVRSMPIFFTVSLLLSYMLIRQKLGRGVAAGACLLLSTSPILFSGITSRLWPAFPYFCTSMLALLAVRWLEGAKTHRARILLGVLLCFLIIASTLIQSSGIALIGALFCWLVVSSKRDPTHSLSRLKVYLPIILLAVFAEGLWMAQGSNPPEWPLHGYPNSYLSQLKLKSGNNPELGLASLTDVASRIDSNLRQTTELFLELLTQHWVNPSYSTAGISVTLILIFLGLGSSIFANGGKLEDWYFILYEGIYVLWPWSLEVRFFLPVAPLACFFLVKGTLALADWCSRYPRKIGACCLPLSVVLGVNATIHGWRAGLTSGLQFKFSAIFWFFCAAVSLRMIWSGPLRFFERLRSNLGVLGKRYSVWGHSLNLVQLLGALVVLCLVVTEIAADVPVARANLSFNAATLAQMPDIAAARWINEHADPNDVVAARRVPLVYHYCLRRVIWFPPITDAIVLMKGMREHNVRYVIVVNRDYNYYQPPDTYSFKQVSQAFPQAFRLAESNGPVEIYEVLPDLSH